MSKKLNNKLIIFVGKKMKVPNHNKAQLYPIKLIYHLHYNKISNNNSIDHFSHRVQVLDREITSQQQIK